MGEISASTEPLGSSPNLRLWVVLRDGGFGLCFQNCIFCSDQHGFVVLVFSTYSICVSGYFLKFSLQLSS